MKTDSNILNLSTLGDMGLYVHIPFCKQKCMYCDFPAYQNLQDYYETYVYALVQEMDLWVSEHPESKAKPIDTIYFGGGTPTELSIQQLQMIVDKIKSTFTITDDCHMTIESNPGEVDLQYLTKLVKLGFNRISFGVQTFDDKALTMLHRSHNGEKAKQAVYEAKEAGFTDINIDLIYGLPRQTLEDIQHNLHILKDLPINHISTYGLQVEVGTYLYHLVQKNLISIPSESIDEAMYDTMMEGLKNQGFERYEISNFAKDSFYSRHNLKYWHYVDYLGFGAGAHSFYEGIRRSNNRNVMPYIQAVDRYTMPTIDTETITVERAQEDFCFLALRTKWGLDEQKFEDRFGVSVHKLFGNILEDLVTKGLLEYQNGSYHLSSEGAKHGNYVFSQFIRE
ncbi:radical SAM family heme chaperone HemW [Veillonella sp.]|jgi:putative coproporphyrinogen dehydrogenase|uniref:radical SAM family heme chaperone HemW n=1 Tax=Veillonella sp. TaxID=1926307 RepID=UPI0028FE6B84|nr:radical SAM family heme chaperone HemW [Veillonella sp.]MDU2710402.1 radical SAM family heme chaperone HemW [Veillonella sp.]MDU3432887.1 radical SAM family heme chaperone HemW [Veillonella sp.]MDU4712101.1 radical SAM family heme chaperone HemW [Veillonella sp.]MDU5494420.1 radical SAM family heme chaperone HemW [Veillonella sp.]